MWASALAYVVAQMAVVLLHEGAHTITGVLQGLRAIQFTGEVRFDPDPGGLTLVWRALAGPLFSLASGALLALMRPWHGDGFGRLLTTWFAFLSMQEGLGYLIVAPVLRAGDTGAALAELNAPWIAYAASVAVGVAGMFWLASRCAIEGVELTRDLYEMRAFCVWGWLIGTAGSLVLAAAALALTPGTDGGAAVGIMVGASTLGVFAPMAMLFWVRAGRDRSTVRRVTATIPRWAWAVLAAGIVLNLAVLPRGISVG